MVTRLLRQSPSGLPAGKGFLVLWALCAFLLVTCVVLTLPRASENSCLPSLA